MYARDKEKNVLNAKERVVREKDDLDELVLSSGLV